jgi:fluoroacetyl-CoA thioesterase
MLTIGLRREGQMTVQPDDSAARGLSIVPDVLASARMIYFIECVCAELLAEHLADGQGSVGIGFDLTHEAPTPIGMTVRATVELVEIDGRRCVFAVEARDEVEVIGRGRHTRALIDRAKFDRRIEAKRRT